MASGNGVKAARIASGAWRVIQACHQSVPPRSWFLNVSSEFLKLAFGPCLDYDRLVMQSEKRPGWGLVDSVQIIKTRTTSKGEEALILPPGHEAPFWIDLQQVAQHRGRFIYQDISQEEHP